MPLFHRKGPDTAPFERRQVSADYAGRLAFVGRRLDEARCRSATVIEISGSYIVRATDASDGASILNEFVAEDFEVGDVRVPVHGGSPGYERALGAIGRQLDRRVAANVAIIETSSGYQVVGWERGQAAGQATYVPFNDACDHGMLERMVAQDG